MLEEYNVGDLIRVHSKDYLEDKYEWKYDVEKDSSNYHQIRFSDEEHLAELISDITKSTYKTKEQVLDWLATDKQVGEL